MQSLQTLIRRLERSPQWQSSALFRQLLALWPQLVGSAVAQHSRPYSLQKTTLRVAVSSAAWAQTLMFERLRILQKLHQQLPMTASEIDEIRFSTVHWPRVSRSSRAKAVPKLEHHPSWAKPVASANNGGATLKTPEQVFRQWSLRKQAQLASQSLCPHCKRPCPVQELQRWSRCAICMTHVWQQNGPASRH